MEHCAACRGNPATHRVAVVIASIVQANGLVDPSEYYSFITQLNEIGQSVDEMNAKATKLRVQVFCLALARY